MFIHFGLYSMLGRGEWVMNRERFDVAEYQALADQFNPTKFDADAIADLAVRGGMRYIVLTTMHHDGFCIYNTKLTNFNSVQRAAKRDFVQEIINAARKRGLKIGLYHSLNNWSVQPDACAALENKKDYDTFIANTFTRLRELVTLYNPIDIVWYDGWWPFNAQQWQGEKMNAMIREIQPHVLFNGRNGLPGDFATPEGHMGAPNPWRPWEGCMTLNDNWGFHHHDHAWKSPSEVVNLLATAAKGQGNLLLNIGPKGNGSVPEETVKIIEAVGSWLKRCGDAIYDTDRFTMNLEEVRKPGSIHRGDWYPTGPITAKGNSVFFLIRRWPGEKMIVGGFQAKALKATLLGEKFGPLNFKQDDRRIIIEGLPAYPSDSVCPVIRVDFDRVPEMYIGGGMRTPNAPHPHYDPCPSDLQH